MTPISMRVWSGIFLIVSFIGWENLPPRRRERRGRAAARLVIASRLDPVVEASGPHLPFLTGEYTSRPAGAPSIAATAAHATRRAESSVAID
jgi:hypothetical protein